MASAKTEQKQKLTYPIKSRSGRAAATLLLVMLGFAGIYLATLLGSFGAAVQWLLALFILLIIGTFIRQVNLLTGWYGIYLASTKKGIALIDRISHKYKWFWNGMSEWGIVLGLGVMAYPFLKGKIDKRLFVFGLISIAFMMYFVLGAALSGFQFISLPQLQISSGAAAPVGTGLSLIGWALLGFTVLFGFTGLFIILLLENAATIILKTVEYTSSVVSGAPQNSILAGVIPGVAPLIPGIDIPLVAGIASLAVLLIVHEFAHGILARLAKVRLKSIGLLMLGVIPIGAFVEPDEKQVAKLSPVLQSRILAAGSASNFVWAVIFFVLLLATVYLILPGMEQVLVYSTTPGFPAYNALVPGSQILYWQSHKIENLTSLEAAAANDTPGNTVSIVTSAGSYSFTAISVNGSTKGYIGVTPYEGVPNNTVGTITEFFYSFFSLSLLFNISLAIINLFPIPLFDGWRLWRANIKNPKITKWFAIFVVVLLLVNLFAWVLIGIA